jgi:hypothetical protein
MKTDLLRPFENTPYFTLPGFKQATGMESPAQVRMLLSRWVKASPDLLLKNPPPSATAARARLPRRGPTTALAAQVAGPRLYRWESHHWRPPHVPPQAGDVHSRMPLPDCAHGRTAASTDPQDRRLEAAGISFPPKTPRRFC